MIVIPLISVRYTTHTRKTDRQTDRVATHLSPFKSLRAQSVKQEEEEEQYRGEEGTRFSIHFESAARKTADTS